MQKIDRIIELAGHRKEDLSACLGCKICASVCTVNDLGIDTNPQELLVRLFSDRTWTRNFLLYATAPVAIAVRVHVRGRYESRNW